MSEDKGMTAEEFKALGALVRAEEVGDFLGISWRTVQRLATSGEIPAVKVGHVWRFPVSKVLEYAGLES